jgi:hypothetical protein
MDGGSDSNADCDFPAAILNNSMIYLMANDFTFIIKTLLRPRCVHRLIDSRQSIPHSSNLSGG